MLLLVPTGVFDSGSRWHKIVFFIQRRKRWAEHLPVKDLVVYAVVGFYPTFGLKIAK